MYDEFKVAYIKLNTRHVIQELNSYFVTLFGLPSINQAIGLDFDKLAMDYGIENAFLCGAGNSQSYTRAFLVFQNYGAPDQANKYLLVLYVLVETTKDGVTIWFTNWLNWLHNLDGSLNNNYQTISQVNCDKCEIETISEAHCFKALYPLLAHIPHDFIGQISSKAYFNILHIFNKKRGENRYSKDYNRDTLSRIKHALKKDFGVTNIDITNIIKYDQLINLKVQSELLIPNTRLNINIVVSPVRDNFLEGLMKDLML